MTNDLNQVLVLVIFAHPALFAGVWRRWLMPRRAFHFYGEMQAVGKLSDNVWATFQRGESHEMPL